MIIKGALGVNYSKITAMHSGIVIPWIPRLLQGMVRKGLGDVISNLTTCDPSLSIAPRNKPKTIRGVSDYPLLFGVS